MTLFIDSKQFVQPVKQGGWGDGETWFNYVVYRLSDLKRVFKGYSLRDCLNDNFSYGSNGAGQAYSRKPSFRLHKGFFIVGQRGGLDI